MARKPESNGNDPLVTREGASQRLDRNVRTIGRALGEIPPDDAGPPARWRLSTIRQALAARADRTGADRGNDKKLRLCYDIERLSEDAQSLIERLRAEPDQAKRLYIATRDGRCIGALERALRKSVDLSDDVDQPLNEAYVEHKIIGPMFGEVFSLLGVTDEDLKKWAAEAA